MTTAFCMLLMRQVYILYNVWQAQLKSEPFIQCMYNNYYTNSHQVSRDDIHHQSCRVAVVEGKDANQIIHSVFSPAKTEGIGERHNLVGASAHIKGFGSTPIPLQRQISNEWIGGPYPLSMLGRTMILYKLIQAQATNGNLLIQQIHKSPLPMY